jgi:hypothetical protein
MSRLASEYGTWRSVSFRFGRPEPGSTLDMTCK